MSAYTIPQALLAASENPIGALIAKATLAMLAALLLIHLTRRASASLRHLVAAATFGVLLLLPLATLLIPTRVIKLAPQAITAPPVNPARVGPSGSTPQAALPATAAASVPRVDTLTAVGAIYLLGAGWLALSLLAGIFRLHRLRGRAEVSVEGTRLANTMARALGMPGGIEVVVSPELAVPITFGGTHPVILLPAETAQWDEAELGRAIRHELEHVARGDFWAHILSRLALALYWPHPFAWLLWRRLRLEAERACDDAVIRSHGQAEPYAEQLVSLARRLSGRGAVPALSMATRSNLGLRVEAILDDGRRRAPRSWLTSLVVGAAAVAGVLAIAPYQVMGDTVAVANESTDSDQDEDDSLDVALLEAAEKGNVPRMLRLLDSGARANAAIGGDGSPLIAAARRGQLEAMKVLIARGADVNRGMQGDGNPLIAAARGGYLEPVRLLLDHGAEIDRGVRGDGNALIMAAGDGRLEMVRFLLDQGASLEKVVPGDENPLIHASESGQVEVVRLLIERGADVNARVWADGGKDGVGEWRTPLVMARRNRHEEVVRILLAAGARE